METALKELRDRLGEANHYITSGKFKTYTDWVQADRPHVWEIVQETDRYVWMADRGHGYNALFLKAEDEGYLLIGLGSRHQSVVPSDVQFYDVIVLTEARGHLKGIYEKLNHLPKH